MRQILCDMPTLSVSLSIRGQYFNELQIDRLVKQPTNRDTWLQVHANQEYTLHVNITRHGNRTSNNVHCPKFSKGKTEGWFLTLGRQYDGQLMALKRIVCKNSKTSHQLSFLTPQSKCMYLQSFY